MRRELTRIEPVRAANVVDSGPLVTLVLLYPVFGAVGGWIGVFVMTHLYDFVARRVGGIRIEVASSEPVTPGAA